MKMFAKLTLINNTGATTGDMWVNKDAIKTIRRVSANADAVDHTVVTLEHTADGQEVCVWCSETPEQLLPSETAPGFRS